MIFWAHDDEDDATWWSWARNCCWSIGEVELGTHRSLGGAVVVVPRGGYIITMLLVGGTPGCGRGLTFIPGYLQGFADETRLSVGTATGAAVVVVVGTKYTGT